MAKSDKIRFHVNEMTRQVSVIQSQLSDMIRELARLQIQVTVLNNINDEPEKTIDNPGISVGNGNGIEQGH